MFFIVYAFKGQVHVFAGRVKIINHWSCRISAILKYFCPLYALVRAYFLSHVNAISTSDFKPVQCLKQYPDQLIWIYAVFKQSYRI